MLRTSVVAMRSAARPSRLASACAATDHEFTVIIPAYNEERRLPKSLHELGAFLDSTGLDYRVIVADDGSTDRTPELAAECGRRFSTVRLAKNGGKGRSAHRHADRDRPGHRLYRCRSAVSLDRPARRVRPARARKLAKSSSAAGT